MSDKLDLQTPDLVNQNIRKIAALFPNCVTETENGKAIDFDQLRQELNHNLVEGPKERYRLEWPGKREAIVTANLPTTNTLRPVPEESVDFENTKNLYIEGDNLEVLKLLQESYLGKIKMIYIDPPYNTGNDFIYNDKFTQDSDEFKAESGLLDELGNRLVQNPETAGRYHSDWLSMMYPRLKLARNLLTDDGVIFISIDDNEVHNLKKMCDEVFGERNFLGLFIVNSSPSGIDYGHIAKTNDYALFFAKDYQFTITHQIEEEDKRFTYNDEKGGFNLYPLYNGNAAFNDKTRPNLVYPFYLNPNNNYKDDFYEISIEKKEGWVEIFPVVGQKDNIQRVWRWGKLKAKENLNDEIVGFKNREGEFRIVQKSRLTSKVIRSLQLDNEVSSRRGTLEIEALLGKKVFSYPKPSALIARFAAIATSSDSIILDFFSGSSSTAHAILKLNAEDGGNRKFIMVQLPEKTDEKSEAFKAGYKTICEVGKERIRRAAKKIKAEMDAKQKEKSGKLDFDNSKTETRNSKPDFGFRVFRLDTSNMQDVYYRPQDYRQDSLDLFADNVKEGRTAMDLVTQVMLDWGLPLSLKIEEANIAGKTIYKVAGNSLYCCFDKGVDEAFAKEIAKEQPLRVVFRDSSFASDTAKENVKQLLKQLIPEDLKFEMKVI
jgi:adenine-specific DNA-methyltransferase